MAIVMEGYGGLMTETVIRNQYNLTKPVNWSV